MGRRVSDPVVLGKEGIFNEDQLDFLLKNVYGEWEYNYDTGLVDVLGQVLCDTIGIKDLYGIRFGVICGDFEVSYNYLTKMEGFPNKVTGELDIRGNNFVSLRGLPSHVGKLIVGNTPPLEFATYMSIMGFQKQGYSYDLALIKIWDNLRYSEKRFLHRDLPEDHELYASYMDLGLL